ncbi:MAG: phospholipid-binding protein [Coleofasciculus sp. S288]|nr:phospholipid-binding protein [Coleofasciculus sp. S288]
MGWLKRLFGLEKPKNAKVNPTPVATQPTTTPAPSPAATETIPPERVGLNGEYDQSGLAKRVALAFDEEPDLADEERLWVAQTGSTVVLKGQVSDQATLNKMVSVAKSVNGCTAVDTSQANVG